ncbi:hypothetical protein [Bradyrhizobium sp.]|jgi:hypothetical protein|uniref:hypothetical protein n=1 Tax=Bradyrhizobium sp. TaxID=376 RepID=UPI002E04D360|nr:hypothetical protein [Bradyrhizobium sp.]
MGSAALRSRLSLVKAVHFDGVINRNALLIYTVWFFALIHPFWLFGEIIAPYQLVSEIRGPEVSDPAHIQNIKFADYWHAYIPEIRDQLQAPRSGWLALWTSPNELGRPILHDCFSAAYAPTWLLLKITNSPFQLLTVLSLGTCFLTGLFVLLLCREMSLQPVAGLIAGASVAASPLMLYWLTFPMFPSVICWSAGLLYAMTRLAKNVDPIGCAVLAFSSYSLLMTAYQQAIIFQAYVLTGYLLRLAYRRWQSMGTASSARYLGIVVSSGVSGILLALPGYVDLAEAAANSSRAAPDIAFFLSALPTIDSVPALIRMFSISTFPEITENPVSPAYPFPYNGLSITPLILFLAFFGLLRCFRETWGWWLAIVLICAFTFIHPLYAFAVRYMAFNLSRGAPLGTIILPLTIVAAHSVNAMAARFPSRTITVTLAILATVVCFAVAFGFYWTAGLNIRWNIVLATLVVICLLALQVSSFRPAFLIAALAVVGATISFPLMLRQPAAQPVPSPVVDRIIAATGSGSRFAIAAPGPGVLPPNLNDIFDVASVHSYDSLSSRRYQALIRDLGGETQTYGRLNTMISPDYDSQAFWMSNIGLMISPKPLDHPNLQDIGADGEFHFYRVLNRMGCCLQTALSDKVDAGRIDILDRKAARTTPLKTRDEGDLLEFEVRGGQSSILVLSQQYHRHWQAVARTPSGWVEAPTLPVNGAFQGIRLPAETQTVRLQFLPFVRFAWIAHVFLAFGLLILVVQAIHRRQGWNREGRR